MASGNPYTLKPDIAPEVEIAAVMFDFAPLLPPSSGLSVTSVEAVTITATTPALDPSPADRLVGGPIIVSSDTVPAVANAAVVIYFGNAKAGCTYKLQCVAIFSDSAQHRSIELELSAKRS